MLSLIDFRQKDSFPAQAIQVAEVETTMSDEESWTVILPLESCHQDEQSEISSIFVETV